GNLVKPGFFSGVSPFAIPYVHGLTVGELAQYLNGEGLVPGGKKCDLRVVKMEGWTRDTLWFDTGLPWVSTSPHVPKPETAFFYAAT
ncbi:exo-beta-N-acetylmuramidase NamZ domain-containing protein, partial [Acinetobacter baumannii]